jgi:hypothetical protein
MSHVGLAMGRRAVEMFTRQRLLRAVATGRMLVTSCTEVMHQVLIETGLLWLVRDLVSAMLVAVTLWVSSCAVIEILANY